MRVDLHLHSTASDGALTPAEVVQAALKHRLDAIALTDHDTVEGVIPAQQAAQGAPLRMIAGVELSAEEDGKERHVLGYAFDPSHAALNNLLARLKAGRIARIHAILEKLGRLGITVAPERVFALAQGGSVGRPHVARALVAQGVVSTVSEAFQRYLANGAAAFVPNARLSLEEAIAVIHQSGGVAVLAHPGRLADYRTLLTRLLPLGLDGVEVYYPDHGRALIRELRAFAFQHKLLITGGSDFHRRDATGSVRIGALGFPKDFDPIAAIEARAARYR
ncbi:MAG: phosphatase [Candidatus Thermofonsia Clade 1 bacterium]|uniref:Phosphatase n=1 Tax=Candidatus Thermofonsia Clade 1 bacterium TaxID=2364210 RepID=A0A2M8PHJ3_9CHLR|nr:MAG: phosphatase [Candidatus Thermofonsia Clade 1 bacterium]